MKDLGVTDIIAAFDLILGKGDISPVSKPELRSFSKVQRT